MADFLDISKWEEKEYFQTKGTRNKCVVEHPKTSNLFFFKTSMLKEKKDYKHEFWSEIIASEVGEYLGFNMLNYNIAYKNGEIGCISKSMINLNKDQLIEGVNYLQGYDPSYIPDFKQLYDRYTFHFICNALKEYSLENRIPNLIKTIIFDSLIGNGDRHQENWGFILFTNERNPQIIKMTNKLLSSYLFKGLFKIIGLLIIVRKNKDSFKQRIRTLEELFDMYKGSYSPIYDSGSCLGRELEDNKIELMLEDNKMLQTYIDKGTSEIRWEGPKIKHFELIRNIKNEKRYEQVVKNEINRIRKIFDEQKIRKIVLDIDKNLPENFIQYKLPDNRKELIIKMITLRYKKLIEILE